MVGTTEREGLIGGERRQRREWCRPRDPAAIGLGPASAYEAVTRQMVEALGKDLEEIKGRLNGVLFMVAGAIVIDVALRLVGVE